MRRLAAIAALAAVVLLAAPAGGHFVGLVYYPPAVGGDGSLYVSGTDGVLYGLRANGSPEWTYDAGRELTTVAVARDGRVYAGLRPGEVVAVDAATGSPAWTADLPEPGTPPPVIGLAVDGDDLYAATGRAVYAVAPNGSVRWRFEPAGRVYAAPAAGPDGVYVAAAPGRNGSLYALSPDGTVRWRRSYDARVEAVAVTPEGSVVFEAGGHLRAVRPDGTRLWTVEVGDVVAPPATDGRRVVVGTFDGRLLAVREGSVVWTHDVGDLAAPSVGPDGRVYAVTLRSVLAVADGERLWRTPVGTTVTLPPAVGEHVYVGTQVNRTYAVARDGEVAWVDRYDTPLGPVSGSRHDLEPPAFLSSATRPATRVVGPDGSVATDRTDAPGQRLGLPSVTLAVVAAVLLFLALLRVRD